MPRLPQWRGWGRNAWSATAVWNQLREECKRMAIRFGWRPGLGIEWVHRVTLGWVVLLAGCFSTPVSGQHNVSVSSDSGLRPFDQAGVVDPDIPTPEAVLGHPIGDRAVRYEETIRYIEALSASSPRVWLARYGETHEGRSLYYLTITGERNLTRLAEIKEANDLLHDPRRVVTQAQADRIIGDLPGIAWLGYSIHGDELSSTDAALQVAYQLAAGEDQETRRLRDELVIYIDPLMNPDGRERYLSQLQQLNGNVPNFDYQAMQHSGLWSAGRGNHYLFDLNRDWLMQVHPETRSRAERIIEAQPHLVVDAHEMNGLNTYLFDPPREPFNVNLPAWNLEWRRRFSADQAAAFDRHGWSYYTQEWYEEWYPGYTNAWSNLLGALGILYEQAGVNGGAIRQESGELLTYREAVHHHIVSTFANLRTLRSNRKDILRTILEDRQWAVDSERSGTEVFIMRPSRDAARDARFIDLLRRQGIEFQVARDHFTAEGVVDMYGHRIEREAFPAGSLVVRAAQPHRRLLQAMLQFDPHMSDAFLLEERTDVESGRGSKVYDVTGWNLGMAYALDCYWAEQLDEVTAEPAKLPAHLFPPDPPGYGFVIAGDSFDVPRLANVLLDQDVKVRAAQRAFRVSGVDFEPGALLLRKWENPEHYYDRLRDAARNVKVKVYGVDSALCEFGPDLGGREFPLLAAPRVAVATQWPISTTSFGAVWHLLDVRAGIRCSPLNLQNIGRWDLRRYNVIVLPHTWSTSGIGSILDEPVREKLKRWVEAGGTLIAIGGSAAFLADKDHSIGSVRLRRDVLDKLDEYDEALAREQSARNVQIDPDVVWGTGPSESGQSDAHADSSEDQGEAAAPSDKSSAASGKASKTDRSKDVEALKREDQWLRRFAPRGVIAASRIDPHHWLCFGVPGTFANAGKLPVFLAGGQVFMSKPPGATPVRLLGADELRLSGLMWPEARKRAANSAYATVERMGHGQVILFASDPVFRGYFEGTARLLLNAIILGPGMGTNQPVPW